MKANQRFLVQRWSDGCAVFDQETGDTHTLDLPSYEGLVAMQRGLPVEETVYAALCSLHPEMSADELARLAQDCCSRLEQSGLLENESRN